MNDSKNRYAVLWTGLNNDLEHISSINAELTETGEDEPHKLSGLIAELGKVRIQAEIKMDAILQILRKHGSMDS